MCRSDGGYVAGQLLHASWRVGRIEQSELESVEVTILWSTDGKGDEDIGVHHFERFQSDQWTTHPPSQPRELQCRLPAAPLSYTGRLICIQWCIRVRAFLTDGREIVTEQPFYVVAAPNERQSDSLADEELAESPSGNGKRTSKLRTGAASWKRWFRQANTTD